MSKNNSTPSPVQSKPAKPSADFPLFPHATKRWAKKIQGRMHYFGPWSDPDGALERYKNFLVGEAVTANGKRRGKRQTRRTVAQPEQPAGSPFFWHRSGQWCKKIRGQHHYFGRGSHAEALTEYERVRNDLHTGKTTKRVDEGDGLTIFRLCAKFLETKKLMRDAGELSVHSFNDYARVCNRLVKVFGRSRLVADLGPDDFEKLRKNMAKTWGAVRLGNEINRVRVVFNYAKENGLLTTKEGFQRALTFGQAFRRPSRKDLRKLKAAQGPKMFEADEIRRMIDAAGQPLKAMILLGINCGFGNADCGTLPMKALDLDGGWVNYPRPKTGVARRCPLWPETVAALRAWLAVKPAAKRAAHAELVFVTAKGDSWAKETSDNPVSKETAKLLAGLKINGHRNFYGLRHSLQTIGDDARDFLAVRHIMGHVGGDIADEYREKMSDARLLAVTNHIHAWLWPAKAGDETAPAVLSFRAETA